LAKSAIVSESVNIRLREYISAIDDGFANIFLGFEVVVDIAQRYPGILGDIAERGLLVSLTQYELVGGAD
jgi:hypothetical protein